MVVPDALQDYRFAGNPMVQGDPFIRFYAGQPLRGQSGYKVGTLCIADREPRKFGDHDLKLLGQLGRLVEREFTLLDQIQMQIENLRAKEEIERKSVELERAVAALSREKEHSEILLRNLFPGDVAQELKNNGRVKAIDHEKVSVLFSDFSNFTSVSNSYTDAELVEELNHCFCLFDGLCGRHGVEKLKTIGDGYLCVSGLQGCEAEGGMQLLRFAEEVMAFLLQRKIDVEATGRLYWSMRIGIHCGSVVSGVVGVKRMAYDMWGDTGRASAPIFNEMVETLRSVFGEGLVIDGRQVMVVDSPQVTSQRPSGTRRRKRKFMGFSKIVRNCSICRDRRLVGLNNEFSGRITDSDF